MFVEFGGKLFVLAEGKHGSAHLPFGQRLAFERLVDALHDPPTRISIGFVVEHDTTGDIDFAQLPVRAVRYKGEWRPPTTPCTPVAAITNLRAKFKV